KLQKIGCGAERQDAQPFRTVLEPLEKDPTLVIPSYDITLSIDVGSIPTGVNWKEVSQALADWLRKQKDHLPDGKSTQAIPDLSFDLSVVVDKTHIPGYSGKVFVARNLPEADFEEVIRKALSDKVPKLIAAPADRKILLFEKNVPVRSNTELAQALKSLKSEYPDLVQIDELWLANTTAWDTEKVLWLYRVTPPNHGQLEIEQK
ncbi:MAG: hypothetical protein ACE5JX_21435, partial [Acidobacteriota bacterium]